MGGKTQKTICMLSFVLLAIAITYRIMNPFVPEEVTHLTYTGQGTRAIHQDEDNFVTSSGIRKNARENALYAPHEGNSKETPYFEGQAEEKNVLFDKNNVYFDDVFVRYFNRQPFSGDVTRDIFLRKADRVVKVPKTVSPPEEKKKSESIKKELKPDPRQEAIDYISSLRFLGYYESGSDKAIFFSREKLVIVARKGDRLNDKYLLEEITDKAIRINALDINEIIHLDIKEFHNE